MTVFDPSALGRLVDDSAGRPFTIELARTFRRLLPPRVDRLRRGLSGEVPLDHDDLMDAVLSLRVSCSMVGAHELAELARAAETHLRAGNLPGARSCVTVMPRAAGELDTALGRYLERVAA